MAFDEVHNEVMGQIWQIFFLWQRFCFTIKAVSAAPVLAARGMVGEGFVEAPLGRTEAHLSPLTRSGSGITSFFSTVGIMISLPGSIAFALWLPVRPVRNG